MTTLCIVNLKGDEVRSYCRDAARGDAEAKQELGNLFKDREAPLECFLCARVFDHQPAVMILPDGKLRGGHIGVGICLACHSLPEMYR